MPYPRKPNYDRAASQATTIYLPKELHQRARQHALRLGAAEGATVSQSELITRALTEYLDRAEGGKDG